MKKRAREMGTTTITPPQKRLLRKFDREGVMGGQTSLGWILGSAQEFLGCTSPSFELL
jgi:hypothetical protein